jgi:hypothetical protein
MEAHPPAKKETDTIKNKALIFGVFFMWGRDNQVNEKPSRPKWMGEIVLIRIEVCSG